MNRKIILMLLVITLFTLTLNVSAQQTEQFLNNDLSNSIFYSPDYNSIDINDYILRLPSDDIVLRDFETQYQDRLKELADQYGSSPNDLLNIVFSDNEINDIDSVQSMTFQPSSKLNINVGYNQEDKNEIIENKTAVEVNYTLDDKTAVRAGYEFQNVQEYDVGVNDLDTTDFLEGNSVLLEDESTIDSRLGISYQTTENIRIFADYVYNDILMAEAGESTVFGLEYNNKDSVIAAEYSIIEELNKQGRETGLSYQYEDLATFSASYKLLDPEKIENQLEQQQSWDFGVDFNLNQDSSFSIGLQVINKEVLAADGSTTLQDEDDDSDTEETNNQNTTSNDTEKETNVEASFQIKF